MSDPVTLKQLSEELGVTVQALRLWCKKNDVRKERHGAGKESYVLSDEELNSVRAYYDGCSNENREKKEDRKEKQRKESCESVKSDFISSLQAQNELLSQQLEVKDKQIEALTEQNSSLIKQLDNITAALQAAQALHGIDKQQKAIEVFEAAPAAEPPQDPPQQQPHKRTLSERIRAFFK